MEKAAADKLPEGYQLTWTGTALQELEAGALVVAIFALAIVFAYMFLVAQYESWTTPMSVVLSTVIAMFGALMPIMLLPFLTFNLYAQIGIVMLIGLSAKSAILIVEFAKVRRETGLSTDEAALEAARLRFRAVMMTALSFILGVSPLVISSGAGAASRVSVGFVVFFGMVAATFIGTFFSHSAALCCNSARAGIASGLRSSVAPFRCDARRLTAGDHIHLQQGIARSPTGYRHDHD